MRFEPFCLVTLGAPGAGKSTHIEMLRTALKPRRSLIWDPKREFAGELVTLGTLKARLAALGQGPLCLVYRPDHKDQAIQRARFEFFCQRALEARNLLMVVDELADVTSPNPGEVPVSFSLVLREQRHYGIQLIAASQRPQHLNKDLWDFATRIRSGRLNYTPSRREVCNVLGVEFAEVAALSGCQWIERDNLANATLRGELVWKRGKPLDVSRPGPEEVKINNARKPASNRVPNGNPPNG